VKYGLSPQAGKRSSSRKRVAVTEYPRGSKSEHRKPSPPRQGRLAILATSGIGASASSWRPRLRPARADPKIRAIATLKNEDAA